MFTLLKPNADSRAVEALSGRQFVTRSCLLLGLVLFAAGAYGGQNVVVVLDDSGSMAERMRADRRMEKIEAARRALTKVLETLPADARVGVLVLNRGTGDDAWIIPLGPVDKNGVRIAVQNIRASGSTPLGQFMKVGTDALLEQRSQEHYGIYRLLIVTDGEATDGDLVERYLPDILSRGITVDVIGVDMEGNHSLATKVHTYRRADDPASLAQAISASLAESSSDALDAGESDFELLDSIPGELAAAALTALAGSGNEPIGESPQAGFVQDVTQSPTPAGRTRGGAVGFGFGFCCVFAMLFVAATGMIAYQIVRRR